MVLGFGRPAPGPRRPAIAILLPAAERLPVVEELHAAGFDPVPVEDAGSLADLLEARRDVAVAVLDAEGDPDAADLAWSALHRGGRAIPALLVIDPATLDRIDAAAPGHQDDEYLTRPYTAESIRWRVEAMCIRSGVVDDGSRGSLGMAPPAGWGARGRLVAVFNPKGGVGKTTVATNLATMLVTKGRRVLLVDADTVTGHVPVSLGMEGVPTVADHWRDELEGGPAFPFEQQASAHASGLRVLPLSSSPIHTEILDPARVVEGIAAARGAADVVLADLHPSYSPINLALFEAADRILVPVTPDLPAIRAVVRLRDVADELRVRDRLWLVVNRANTGVPVADLEQAIGLPAMARIRSAGPLLVRAANEGRTLVEFAPREKITQDFSDLADALLGTPREVAARGGFGLLRRPATARA